jgi:ketosteroid isomerase-like protein
MTRVLAVAFLAVLAFPCPAPGADVDDLRAAHEAIIKALNTRDNQAFNAGFYDREARFSQADPFPADIEKASRASAPQVDPLESRNTVGINLQYRVIGTTGLVWGYHRDTLKPKDGPLQSFLNRVLLVYVKSDGKWLRAGTHISGVPSGNW